MLKLTDDHISAVLDSDINHQNCDDMSADKKYDFALELLTPIPQMKRRFGDIFDRFWYKNQCVDREMEAMLWFTRQVKADRGFCGLISTGA